MVEEGCNEHLCLDRISEDREHVQAVPKGPIHRSFGYDFFSLSSDCERDSIVLLQGDAFFGEVGMHAQMGLDNFCDVRHALTRTSGW